MFDYAIDHQYEYKTNLPDFFPLAQACEEALELSQTDDGPIPVRFSLGERRGFPLDDWCHEARRLGIWKDGEPA